KVRAAAPRAPIVMVDKSISPGAAAEFAEKYRARMVAGDFTSDFFLRSLRVKFARQIIIASDDDFDNFEAASKILSLRPHIGHRLLVHSNRLRFLRMLNYSNVVNNALTFNTYHLSAQYMVREIMVRHFEDTENTDTVVIAGFGRFGQTIYEEIQRLGSSVVSDVAIIDNDANRRILVAEEQVKLRDGIRRHVFQGDLGHPKVWFDLEREINLQNRRPLILLATRADDENLRTGLWIKRKYPDAKVMVRTTQPSHFARDVCDAAGIDDFALSEMMVHSMPDEWFDPATVVGSEHHT
ncbi:MAG: NAD-binding protein, partial [Pseudomonadales bacterium]|nr:NAD-binding protein [Pseudomonadales bacterium]